MADPVHAFVCGHPVNHSRSPLIHGHWLQGYGIAGTYRAIDVAPDRFESFATTLAAQGFAGGNVTIPHKEAACRLVQVLDPLAGLIGAANTLWFEDGTLHATNTDAHGFAANLDALAPGWEEAETGLVIGAGGASRAIIHALLEAGIKSVHVANRTQSRAQELAHRFGPRVTVHPFSALNEIAPDARLVVNTTSLGMKGEGSIPLDMSQLKPGTLVTDIVYVPLITPFLQSAMDHGLPVADGLGMLLHQAVPGFEKWFGIRPAVTAELRSLIIADLGIH
ncbi:MAG: shikimate dehydrogenase [Rhizobiaceae bacterium]